MLTISKFIRVFIFIPIYVIGIGAVLATAIANPFGNSGSKRWEPAKPDLKRNRRSRLVRSLRFRNYSLYIAAWAILAGGLFYFGMSFWNSAAIFYIVQCVFVAMYESEFENSKKWKCRIYHIDKSEFSDSICSFVFFCFILFIFTEYIVEFAESVSFVTAVTFFVLAVFPIPASIALIRCKSRQANEGIGRSPATAD